MATDLISRALASSAQASSDGKLPVARSAADIATLSVPSGTDAVRTAGYYGPGLGGGIYVADTLATAALAAAHPRFCRMSANARYFRLLPDDGAIGAEQAGARATAGIDDRPAIQGALDYVAAVRIGKLRFAQKRYELWSPPRTSPVSDPFAGDGQYLVVRSGLQLEGAAETCTLACRSATGGSPETAWQTVGGAVWRGSGITVLGGTQAAPASNGIARFTMRDIVIDGGCNRTANHGVVDPATGDGWDETHKGIRIQDTAVDELHLHNVVIRNFKGELLYCAGAYPTDIELTRCTLHTSNGNALNPSSGGRLIATACRFGNAFQAFEGAGASITLTGCQFFDCETIGFGGSQLAPGATLPSFAFATRDPAALPPWVTLTGVRFDNCGSVHLGSWVRGDLHATDTTFLAVADASSGGLRDIDLTIHGELDRVNGISLFTLQGPPSLTTPVAGAPAGTYVQRPTNIALRLCARRTQDANAAGRFWNRLFAYGGRLDRAGCSVTLAEVEGAISLVGPAADITEIPRVVVEWPRFTVFSFFILGAPVVEVSANQAIAPIGPAVLLNPTGSGSYVVTLATGNNYAEGQRLRLRRQGGGPSRLIFPKTGSGSVSPHDVVLSDHFAEVEFEYNAEFNQWYFVRSTASPRQPAIVAPAGGVTIDGEARAAIASILSLLQANGDMS